MGCASTAKKPHGAHAVAEKGVSLPVDTGEGVPQERPEIGVPIPLSELDPNGEFGMCDRIHFDYDKSDIKAEWEKCLDNIARFFTQRQDLFLLIEGHCDERGTEEYNIALGERRAQSTAQYLIQRGISAERIITKTWGESKPLATGHDESSWKLNRRAEFFGVPQGR
ncbi:MAG: OmpA family protein [Candidatus Omnitrophica bacterium]|nr:OmpA family protein [Candidatus Omnitrophota bacterium]